MDLNLAYRSVVLNVANNSTVKNLVMARGRHIVNRFVAGDALDDALKAADALEAEGVHAILDLLGEMVTSEAQARGFRDEIVALVRAFGAKPYPPSPAQAGGGWPFKGYASLKLTQLGLDLDEGLALGLMREILAEAAATGCFVRIDMEDTPRVAATLRVFEQLLRDGHKGVGLVLQSCLKRSEADLERLLPHKPNLRIVKGAYREPPELAFQDKRIIDAQYLLLAKKMLENGLYTAIATHDPAILEEMKRWTAERGIAKDRFEFQMLYGVRRDEQKKLAREGYTVRAYVPYGTDWYPYLSRRIAERPENALFVLRGLIQG